MTGLVKSTLIFSLIFFISCIEKKDNSVINELDKRMNEIAENYVKLVLNIGQYDPDIVDAYYGPAEWKPKGKVDPQKFSADEMNAKVNDLLDKLEALKDLKADELQTLRFRFLYKGLLALKAKIFMMAGGNFSFDEEANALYDVVPPVHNEKYFIDIAAKLDKMLPGKGNVAEKLEVYKKSFIIPKEKIDTVFKAAIAECRKQTLRYIELPEDENFAVEYVKGKPWGAYNWYKGNSFSVIQINTDLPIYIDRAVGLASHEGYPGHHVYNVLLEKNLAGEKNWIEFSVYPLFSPQSLIAEGTANYGIEVAFPGERRIKFEKEVLFPLAGLDTAKAAEYYNILELTSELNYAVNEAARGYLDGKMSAEEAVDWLAKYALTTKDRAEKSISFIKKYRSYIINYSVGKDIVKDYIERNGGRAEKSLLRWKLFKELISTPQTPSGLIE